MRARTALRFASALVALQTMLVAGCSAAPPPARWSAGASPTAAPVWPLPLKVRLYDPYRLLRPEVRRVAEAEVIRAFGRAGAPVRFTPGDPEAIPATIYRELPSRWDVDPTAIGVAVGERGGRRSVFLSYGAAVRALGHGAGARVPRSRIGVAVGRVLAHELVHAIAPECPHTRTGLMAASLNRRLLTAPGIGFDPLASRYLRRAWTASVLAAGAFGTGPDQ